MFAYSLTLKGPRDFGWYAKHLAVAVSFGYLVVFAVAMFLGRTAALAIVAEWLFLPSNPAYRFVNLFLYAASTGDAPCNTNWWDDRLLDLISWGLFAFLAWFEFFAIGFLSGLTIDTAAAVKRRLFGPAEARRHSAGS